jgi:hypothetical protein
MVCSYHLRPERPEGNGAVAELSVYLYLERRPFLNSREQFLAALDELANFQQPDLAEFDQKRFNEYRLAPIQRLRREFDIDRGLPVPEPQDRPNTGASPRYQNHLAIESVCHPFLHVHLAPPVDAGVQL